MIGLLTWRRTGCGVVSLSKKGEVVDQKFDLGYSDEPDYLSRTYGYKISHGFAEDTLVVSAAFHQTIGSILLFRRARSWNPKKRTPSYLLDFIEFKSQNNPRGKPGMVTPKGIFKRSYKQIGITETLYPGDPVNEREVFYLYPENRPNKRNTRFVQRKGQVFETTNSARNFLSIFC